MFKNQKEKEKNVLFGQSMSTQTTTFGSHVMPCKANF